MGELRAVKLDKIRFYPLNQCALYRTSSKSKLACLLGVPLQDILKILTNSKKYNEFILREKTCEFTGKIKKERNVQQPMRSLRALHERIHKLLCFVTPPQYAQASIKGRSYRSNAMIHKDSDFVVTFDLQKFYSSTAPSRVYDFFATVLKCEPDVAAVITELCTFKDGLPTGSPLSPILSLFANKPMFDEMAQFAEKNKLKFSCYVDDLIFSGFSIPPDIKYQVSKIVIRHGHKLASHKTKFYGPSQAKRVTGVILLNENLCVPHGRFFKVRRIIETIKNTESLNQKLHFSQKLAGLLGEIAYLDGRYSKWSKKVNVQMQTLKKQVIEQALE
ncbi:reverse transcriptase family protein [Undibacterium sp.]|uniref:reverse transcriptase family protein n=1 Tax=Undibacterium sp. TaxID=1914977 RepID=UPI00374CB8FD